MAATKTQSVEEAIWDLEPLVDGKGPAGVDELLDEAQSQATALADNKGHIAEFDGARLATYMNDLAGVYDLVGRAGSYAGLAFSADMSDEKRGALMQKVQERATEIETTLLFFHLEWAKLSDEQVDELLAFKGLDKARHYLRSEGAIATSC